MGLTFEWDEWKAASNRGKHGIGFDEAATAFGDPLSLTITDPDHSQTENRFVLIGESFRGRLLVVVSHRERRQSPADQCSAGQAERASRL